MDATLRSPQHGVVRPRETRAARRSGAPERTETAAGDPWETTRCRPYFTSGMTRDDGEWYYGATVSWLSGYHRRTRYCTAIGVYKPGGERGCSSILPPTNIEKIESIIWALCAPKLPQHHRFMLCCIGFRRKMDSKPRAIQVVLGRLRHDYIRERGGVDTKKRPLH